MGGRKTFDDLTRETWALIAESADLCDYESMKAGYKKLKELERLEHEQSISTEGRPNELQDLRRPGR